MTCKILDWRKAIQQAPKAALPSTARLVLLNLSIYMDNDGKSCFPSTRQQALDTGLSERAICEHISKAMEAGFLQKSKAGYSGKAWAHYEYFATFPQEGADARSVPKEDSREQGADPASVPNADNQPQAADVKSVPNGEGADARSVPQPKGTDFHDTKALTDGQSNSTRELPKEESRAAALLIFEGYVIRLNERHFEGKRQEYGLTEQQLADYLTERDKWLRTLPADDPRVTSWWFPTWKALENHVESMNISAQYAQPARLVSNSKEHAA
jgi:hypothetical protein